MSTVDSDVAVNALPKPKKIVVAEEEETVIEEKVE
jgi:hypothetical protein